MKLVLADEVNAGTFGAAYGNTGNINEAVIAIESNSIPCPAGSGIDIEDGARNIVSDGSNSDDVGIGANRRQQEVKYLHWQQWRLEYYRQNHWWQC